MKSSNEYNYSNYYFQTVILFIANALFIENKKGRAKLNTLRQHRVHFYILFLTKKNKL